MLNAILNDHKPRPGRPTAENAVILYYEERRDLLISLELLFSCIADADAIQALEPRVANVILTYASELVMFEDPKDGTWVKKVLKEIDNQAKAIEDFRNGGGISNGGLKANVGSFDSGPKARFSEEITAVRILSHREERRLLATILYSVASARLFSKADILTVMRWTATIKEPSTDNILPVSLTTLLAILDTTSSEPELALTRANDRRRPSYPRTSPAIETLFSDAKFLTDLHSFVTTRVNWKSSHSSDQNPVQPVVQLAWCLFLIQAFRYKPTLVNETKIWENVVEDAIVEAIQSNALEFCSNSLLKFKKPVDPFEELGWNAGTKEDSQSQVADADPEFQESVLHRVDSLVESFITNASSILRKVRHREEDVLLANSLGRTVGTPNRRRAITSTARGEGSQAGPPEQRHDIESLFSLIATLYRESPDAALKYWLEDDASDAQYRHGRLSAFLRWAADCRIPSMVGGFFDMLGSLATGARSATLAFEFLAQNSSGGDVTSSSSSSGALCSWSSLFDALIFYGIQRVQEEPTEIPPEEVTLLKSFLRLLRIIVTSSGIARATLYDNQRYKPVITLFNLIIQPIPIDLKASLLEAVAAFTRTASKDDGPGMAALALEVAKRTWMTLEGSQILPTFPKQDSRGVLVKVAALQEGILTELEQVETPSKVYPTTSAFVTLLVALLGGSRNPSIYDEPAHAADEESSIAIRTIPENLGAPHRSPSSGIEAYTKFVVEDVLLKLGMREYRNSGERWRLAEKCLAYVERCLAGLDFQAFLTGTEDATRETVNLASSPIHALLTAPGFDILTRLLSGSKLLEEIFSLASVDLEILDNVSASSAAFVHSVLRALRIMLLVFRLQAPFIEVVMPVLL